MRRYFYLVEFKYLTKENYESRFDLGVFSTKRNAKKKIEDSVNLIGFKKYSTDNFEIIKFGVEFDSIEKDKSKVILYCVTHEYKIDNDEFDYFNVFDYFSTLEEAKDKVKYLQEHSRVGKKYPNNFEIVEIKVDNYNSWSEGFNELIK